MIRVLLAATALRPQSLTVEITESSIMGDINRTMAVLEELAALGVRISVDDFGTGYSSLSYLKHFPVNMLKIDKSFISDVTTDPNDAAITAAIVAMGHALELRVVAEGVETEAQVQLLRRLGCDLIQGHFVSRPMTANDFARYLRQKGVSPRPTARPRVTIA